MTVSRTPRCNHFRGGDFFAQHFGNGAQQAGAYNRVVLRQNLQGHMFVDDLRHQVAQLVELVNVARIHQHAVGQGTRLVTAGLVSLVEQRADFRILGEHHAVEVSDQGFATAFQQWHSGFDDGTVLDAKHKMSPRQQGFS
ncbi:hypothetical protein D3C71_586710 [compost metagenome]